jgi:Protein of unknown function (DUF3137)
MKYLPGNFAEVLLDFSPEDQKKLERLQRQQNVSRQRFWIMSGLFIVCAIPLIFGLLWGNKTLIGFAAFVFCLSFAYSGGWIEAVLPDYEAINKRWKRVVFPYLLKVAEIKGEYHTTHDLSAKTFLNMGLYKDPYSYFHRQDFFTGYFKNAHFALYQLGVEKRSRYRRLGRFGQSSFGPTDTNDIYFHGLVLHVLLHKSFSGTWIIPRKRKTQHESDNWLNAVLKYRQRKEGVVAVLSGHPELDASFYIFTRDPREAAFILKPWFCQVLVEVQWAWKNGLAVSFVDTMAALHVGHPETRFDLDRNDNVYPPHIDKQLIAVREFSLLAASLDEAAHTSPQFI